MIIAIQFTRIFYSIIVMALVLNFHWISCYVLRLDWLDLAVGRGRRLDAGLRRPEHEATNRLVVLVVVVVDVGEPAVPGQVHAGQLVLGRDAEQAQLLERQEERAHGAAHEAGDDEDLHDVRRQQPPAAAKEETAKARAAAFLLRAYGRTRERGSATI